MMGTGQLKDAVELYIKSQIDTPLGTSSGKALLGKTRAKITLAKVTDGGDSKVKSRLKRYDIIIRFNTKYLDAAYVKFKGVDHDVLSARPLDQDNRWMQLEVQQDGR